MALDVYQGLPWWVLANRAGGDPEPPFNGPGDLAGLRYWLDASDAATVTQVASAISQWNDKSPNSYNVSQGTGSLQPTYVTAAYNSLNAVSFDGAGDVLLRTNAGSEWVADITDTFYAWVVLKVDGARGGGADYDDIIAFPATNTTRHLRIGCAFNDANYADFFFGGSGGTVSWGEWRFNTGSGIDTTNPVILAFEYAGSNPTSAASWSASLNNVSKTVVANGGLGSQNNNFWVGSSNFNFFYKGDILEVVASTTTNAGMYSYLATKWGI